MYSKMVGYADKNITAKLSTIVALISLYVVFDNM